MATSTVTRTTLITVSLLALAGCPARSRVELDGGPIGPDVWARDPFCDSSIDTDGDGIADGRETDADTDGDGTPNYLDNDSDGDGISDQEERGSGTPCAPRNSDMDGIPDFLDLDSDNDGLPDADEVARGTNPLVVDTDGDGVTDLGEALGTGTDPLDPSSTIPAEDFFVVLPYEGDRVARRLDFSTNINVADVYFIVDTTGSMQESIDNVRSSLSRIVTMISTSIRDVEMGVGDQRDFPFGTDFLNGYGASGDWAYAHRTDITSNVAEVSRGLTAMRAGGGIDLPESQVEALYQTATGEGGTWRFGANEWTLPARTCPLVPDEFAPRRGYPCFRPGALPIIVYVTDQPWHNGPSNSNPYVGISPIPHSFDQAAEALDSIGARFVGVAVDGGGRSDHVELARRLGSVSRDGTPLVYNASGGNVSTAIIEGIQTLIGGTPQDVNTLVINVDGNPGAVDASGFIKAVVPNTGCNASTGACGVSPGVTYASQDETTFYGVIPGTRVSFDLDFYNDFVTPPPTAQIYRARILVLGNGVAELDSRNVYIIVPPDGGEIII